MNGLQDIYLRKFTVGPNIQIFPITYVTFTFFYLQIFINLYESSPYWIDSAIFFTFLFVIEYSVRNFWFKGRPDRIFIFEDHFILSYFFNSINLKYFYKDCEFLELNDQYLMRVRIKGWLFPLFVSKDKYEIVKEELRRIWIK